MGGLTLMAEDWRSTRPDDYGFFSRLALRMTGRLDEEMRREAEAQRLSNEALERVRVWLYPESAAPSAADRAMLGRLGILWP